MITKEKRAITLTDKDGQKTVVEAEVIRTEDGFDEDGNPKVSVEIKIPAYVAEATPGEME